MKKKEILTTTAKRKPLSKELSENYALRTAGSHFTAFFIKDPDNGLNDEERQTIKDFRDDAEDCLTDVMKRSHARRIFSLWIALTVALLGIVTYQCCKYTGFALLNNWIAPTCAILALLSAFVALIYAGSNLGKWNCPGDTARFVAKAWRPVRKKIIDSGLLTEMAGTIRYHHEKDPAGTPLVSEFANWQFAGKELEAVLTNAMGQLSRSAAAAVRRAERDGVKPDKKRFRNQFGQIDEVGQALGYEGLDWKQLNNSAAGYW